MANYSRPPKSFVELVEPFSAEVRAVADQLRSEIVRLVPGATETVYGGLKIANVLYSLGRETNVVCGIQPAANHCKLFLHHVQPGDVAGVKVEGSGKNVRHVKVATREQAQSDGIACALQQAHRGAVSKK